MGTFPIVIGVGNSAEPPQDLITPAQGTAPLAYGQPPGANWAKCVVCDRTIERLVGKLKQFRRVAPRYEKLDMHHLVFVQIASITVWLRTFGGRA
jgi:transposase